MQLVIITYSVSNHLMFCTWVLKECTVPIQTYSTGCTFLENARYHLHFPGSDPSDCGNLICIWMNSRPINILAQECFPIFGKLTFLFIQSQTRFLNISESHCEVFIVFLLVFTENEDKIDHTHRFSQH